MDFKKETYEINRDLFRLRGKHNGVNIGDGEINLLAHIIRLHTNNLNVNKKDYCDASNAHFRDYLYLSSTESGLKIVKERIKKLKTAGFIDTDGKTSNRKIYVQFDHINKLVGDVVSAEPTLKEKKEASRQQTEERLQKEAPEPKESAEDIIKEKWSINAPEKTNIYQCQLWLDNALTSNEIREIANKLGLKSYTPKPKTIYDEEDYNYDDFNLTSYNDSDGVPF